MTACGPFGECLTEHDATIPNHKRCKPGDYYTVWYESGKDVRNDVRGTKHSLDKIHFVVEHSDEITTQPYEFMEYDTPGVASSAGGSCNFGKALAPGGALRNRRYMS